MCEHTDLRETVIKHVKYVNTEIKNNKEIGVNCDMLLKELKTSKAKLRYLVEPGVVYTKKYFRRHLEQYRGWEIDIAKEFVSRHNIRSVVDFGCGVGSYLEGCLQGGSKIVKGYELNFDNSKHFTPPNILPFIEKADITSNVNIDKYECSWSVEVVEHIPEELSSKFIDNLCDASSMYIFFTAARPGQAGTGHINCRDKQYWIDMIEERGFLHDDKEVAYNTRLWDNDCRIPSYIKNNFMFFKRNK